MKITHYVNAMMLLESRENRILCDPWITYGKVSNTDIYNFPEISLSDQEIANINPDYIYITHTHPDHFDPDTLNLFPKNTPILVSWYVNNFTARMISDLGFKNIKISNPENGIKLGKQDRCWINPGTIHPAVDSVAFFELDSKVICNFNDNPFEKKYVENVKEKYGPVDIAIIPYAGHGPYPMFYKNLSNKELREKASAKEKKYYMEFSEYIRILSPDYVIPSAGGVLCGGEKALRYENSGIGSKSSAINYALKTLGDSFKPVLLSELNSYDFDSDSRNGKFKDTLFTSDSDYVIKISKLKNKFYMVGSFHISKSEHVDLTKILTMARVKQNSWQKKRNIISDAAFYFDIGENFLYRVCLNSEEVQKVEKNKIKDKFYEIFILPYSLLIGLCTGHYIWSNIKTQYVNYYRKPDIFDPNLHFLMNFFHV